MSLKASNILLIEPDQVLADITKNALSAQGVCVVHVLTAQAAIIQADLLRPDLVICEIQLVSHSGIEFLYEFRSYTDWQDVPVVILSSVPAIEFAGSKDGLSEQLGITKYLYKPNTSSRQLIRTIEQVLNFVNETA